MSLFFFFQEQIVNHYCKAGSFTTKVSAIKFCWYCQGFIHKLFTNDNKKDLARHMSSDNGQRIPRGRALKPIYNFISSLTGWCSTQTNHQVWSQEISTMFPLFPSSPPPPPGSFLVWLVTPLEIPLIIILSPFLRFFI